MYFIFQYIYVAHQLIQQPMLKLPILNFHEFVIKSDCFLREKSSKISKNDLFYYKFIKIQDSYFWDWMLDPVSKMVYMIFKNGI